MPVTSPKERGPCSGYEVCPATHVRIPASSQICTYAHMYKQSFTHTNTHKHMYAKKETCKNGLQSWDEWVNWSGLMISCSKMNMLMIHTCLLQGHRRMMSSYCKDTWAYLSQTSYIEFHTLSKSKSLTTVCPIPPTCPCLHFAQFCCCIMTAGVFQRNICSQWDNGWFHGAPSKPES